MAEKNGRQGSKRNYRKPAHGRGQEEQLQYPQYLEIETQQISAVGNCTAFICPCKQAIPSLQPSSNKQSYSSFGDKTAVSLVKRLNLTEVMEARDWGISGDSAPIFANACSTIMNLASFVAKVIELGAQFQR